MKGWKSLLVFYVAMQSYSVLAQEALPAPAPAPAADILPVPTQTAFPALPPARPCKLDDVQNKIWKLLKIYQSPYGAEAVEFDAAPWVYIGFGGPGDYNGLYKIVKPTRRYPAREFWPLFTPNEGDPLQQYVVHDKGFIYFYNSGNVVDTQACFIVANDSGPFKQGQMLMMPPAPADGAKPSVRLVKQYQDISPKPRGRKR